ncbi:MAG TPA: rhodanese-like domain-containing protein [Halothiobacillus sp.]|nr:rhodanese-like domain-containing protein [Halothiobacillus sp.]
MILQRVLVGTMMLCALILGQMAFAEDAAVPEVAQTAPSELYASFKLKYVTTDELAKNLDKYTVIDVRSKFSYDVLHVKGSYCVPFVLPKNEFDAQVKKILAETKKPAAFYCNGPMCAMAHRSSIRMQDAGDANTYVFADGILSIANKYPTDTLMYGDPLKSASELISDADFKSRLLTPAKVLAQTDADPKAVIIDIRDPWQRAGISLFQMRDINIPLTEPAQLKEAILHAKQTGRTLYFVDVKGKQVRWLQYLLRANGVTNFWFVKGGAQSLINALQQ